jgi:hypothetical protein
MVATIGVFDLLLDQLYMPRGHFMDINNTPATKLDTQKRVRGKTNQMKYALTRSFHYLKQKLV